MFLQASGGKEDANSVKAEHSVLGPLGLTGVRPVLTLGPQMGIGSAVSEKPPSLQLKSLHFFFPTCPSMQPC